MKGGKSIETPNAIPIDEKTHITQLFKTYKAMKEGKGKKPTENITQTFIPSLTRISQRNSKNCMYVIDMITVLLGSDVKRVKKFKTMLKVSFLYNNYDRESKEDTDFINVCKNLKTISIK